MIPIYTPTIAPYTSSAIKAIQCGWISNHGAYLKMATEDLQLHLKVKHAILMANGTCATHALFLSLKFQHPSITKIYVPNHVFIAAINAPLMEYPLSALEVVRTDPETLNMVEDESYLHSLDRNAAVLVVHTMGNIVNVPRMQRIRPDLVILEDACEGLFGTYEGAFAGTASLAGSISFYGNKTITTGEGGAFLTNNDGLASYIRRIHSHGMTSTRYLHDGLGYNYRMTNIEAAFLYDQLQDLPNILAKKKAIFTNYNRMLEAVSGCKHPTIQPETTHSTWMYGVKLNVPASFYPTIEAYMKERNVEIRPFFYSLPTHPHLQSLKVPNEIRHCVIMLPSWPDMRVVQQETVVNVLQEVIQVFQPTLIPATIEQVEAFLSRATHGEQTTFRYFMTRPVSIIESHTKTLLLTLNHIPIGYAHIDDRWVGLCLLQEAQGCGYGTVLLNSLCSYADSNNLSLRLTVDASNIYAKQLYTKMGFVESSSGYMERLLPSSQITLPVSLGEALDKLSILDIKRDMIRDERREDVIKEINLLVIKLLPYKQAYPQLYSLLKKTNQLIWNYQDTLRGSSSRDSTYVDLCMNILDENDVRFRIKNKINILSNSVLKEQKGYAPKKALCVSHLGMGDMINMVPSVRYYSCQYDQVRVVCKQKYEQNTRDLYKDDPCILVEAIPDLPFQAEMACVIQLIMKYQPTHTLHISGILHNVIHGVKEAPYITNRMDIIEQFYKDLSLPMSVLKDYFWVGSRTPLEDLKRLPAEYIFYHDDASSGTMTLPGAPSPSDGVFLLHPNRNLYEPDTPQWELAQSFLGKPLLYYKDIINNASGLYMIDSSFFCLATHLERPNCKKHYIYTRTAGAKYESIAPSSIWTYISL
jgi:perosamine synthetase